MLLLVLVGYWMVWLFFFVSFIFKTWENVFARPQPVMSVYSRVFSNIDFSVFANISAGRFKHYCEVCVSPASNLVNNLNR